tara:strand:- start:71 stop:892 length:822 start_codon:yes stop_codon:yes gene_type:complete
MEPETITQKATVAEQNVIVEVKTVQSSAIRVLIEGLKDILTDVNFTFDTSGIKLLCMDGNHISLVRLMLDADNFEHYYCARKMSIGLNMSNFFRLIKTVGNNDTITFKILSDNTNEMIINIHNAEKQSNTSFSLKLLDVDEECYNIPEAEFETVITMPSIDFQRITRDMANISDTINISCIQDRLSLSCEGDFASQETIIGGTMNGMHMNKKDDVQKPVGGMFQLKFINLFTKCTNLCSNIEIYLKNDYPLLLKYSVASLGYVLFCLAPKTAD